MTWFGNYTLDLYCDRQGEPQPGNMADDVHEWNEFPHQFTDEIGSTCRAMARKAGWIIKNDGTAICPRCSGKKRNRAPAG